jgi:hypothetical protein
MSCPSASADLAVLTQVYDGMDTLPSQAGLQGATWQDNYNVSQNSMCAEEEFLSPNITALDLLAVLTLTGAALT